MNSTARLRAVPLALVFAVLLVMSVLAFPAMPAHAQGFRALLFTETQGFRHGSIPDGVAMFSDLATENGFEIVHTEDSTIFNDADLATFDVVIMFQASGMVWDNDAQRQAIQDYVGGGGGIVAIHNATDMGIENEFPWWDGLVNGGAHMPQHSPGVLEGTAHVADKVHPSTRGLPDVWTRAEEWYNFDVNPRGDVHVLVTADEDTYDPGPAAMGPDHPISWCREVSGARVWSTAMGHPSEAYAEPLFRQHILGGVEWAAGAQPGDCGGTVWSNFEKVTLDDNTADPMELDVAADGRVFYIQRAGELRVFKPDINQTVTAGTLDVYTGGEDGLVGMALDPNFAENNSVYLYYSPADATEDINRLSRFTMTGDTLDPDSEQVLLDVPAYRDRTFPEPGHTGGGVEFGPNGNLFLSTGDDVPPNLSPDWQGYAPIDWREGEEMLDAARTAGNTNDLRGKLLRITPQADGTYTVPGGNLFAPGTENTRPEIFAMGFRNPFRFTVDPQTGWVHLADYGPDRGGETTERGPAGYVEYNIITDAGNYGWPFCHGNDFPYAPYNPGTGEVGEKFDCENLANPSPNNTGLTELPPAQNPVIWYGYDLFHHPEFPEMGAGGAAPMSGPVYRYDPDNPSPTKFPEYYDGASFFYEWSRNYIKEIRLDEQGGLVKINPYLPTETYLKPMDMTFGPDGSMYLLEWGTQFGGGNNDSGLYRIDYVKGTRSPIAEASATPTNGQPPLTVQFSSEGTTDPDGDPLTFAWDFDGDGTTDSTEPNPSHTYTENGDYTAQLTVDDGTGRTAFANILITVGNTAPTVTFHGPPNGGMINFGDEVSYGVTATDPEDGDAACDQVLVNPALGHDDHEHPTADIPGCTGTTDTSELAGHAPDANLYYVLNARYEDNGGDGASSLTGFDKTSLYPKHRQAEYYTDASGVGVVDQSGAEANARVGHIDHGDWIAYEPVNLTGIEGVRFRYSSAAAGGTVELRAGAPDGELLATQELPNTGGWNNYVWTEPVSITAPVTSPGGTFTLYAVVTNPAAEGSLLDLDVVEFKGTGVASNAAPEVTATAEPVSGEVPLPVQFTAQATDPDGDTPLTYAWSFGDGGTSQQQNPAHTYTQPGTYDAMVTVTDATGRSSSASVTVEAEPQPVSPIICLGARSDEFDGDALDTSRWTTVLPEGASYAVADGTLTLPTAPGDINEANTGPISFVGQGAPQGNWEATTRVTLDPSGQWQQAGILLHADHDNYVKLDLLHNGGGRSVEFVRETDGTRNFIAIDGNLPADFPTTFYLRMASNGAELSAYYSADGVTWTQVGGEGATHPIIGMESPNFGPFALKADTAAPVIDAEFDWFYVSPDEPTGTVEPGDEFDGDRLDGCRWNAVLDADLTRLRLATGQVEIDTTNADFNGTNNAPIPNLLLQEAPDGDWVMETKMHAPVADNWQLAGLLVYGDQDNYVKFDVVADNEAGQQRALRTELVSEVDADFGGGGQANLTPPASENDTWWLRLAKTSDTTGDTYAGEISADGENWQAMPQTVTNALEEPRIGLMATGPQQAEPVTVSFDYFHLSTEAADTTPPQVTVSGVADGETYGDSGDLEITWEATDADSGVDAVSATLDGAPIEQGHRQPLYELPLGSHTVAVTATDEAGNATTAEMVFTTETSFADVEALIERFSDEGWLSRGAAERLGAHLDSASRADASSRERQAARALGTFQRAAERMVDNATARDVLVRDSRALIDQIQR